MYKFNPDFGQRVDPDRPWPGAMSLEEALKAETLQDVLNDEAAERERERQRREDRENDERIDEILRRAERRRKRHAKLKRDWVRQKLAQRPRTQLVFPSPRERRGAPVRRPGSRRTTATRGSPDDSGNSDPDGGESDHHRVVGGRL